MPALTALLETDPSAEQGSGPAVETQETGRIAPLKIILFPARAFLALGWIRAAVEKVISPSWWKGEELQAFVAEHAGEMLPYLRPMTETINAPTAVAISLLVLVLELVIGFCLVTTRHMFKALVAACSLNVAFVALGAVTPSAFYLVLQLTLLLAMMPNRPPLRFQTLASAAAGCLAIATLCAPFIRTLHPHEVIEDPAMMLATLAMLMAATFAIMMIDDQAHRPATVMARGERRTSVEEAAEAAH